MDGVNAESVSAVVQVIQVLVMPLLSLVLVEVRAMRRALARVTVKLAKLETAVEIHLGVSVNDQSGEE